MKTITEFLQSADKEKFTNLLLKKYSKYLQAYGFNDDELFTKDLGDEIILIISVKHLMDELINKTDFVQFCRRLQWVPTFTGDAGRDKLVMVIEPITSSKIQLNKTGYVYHITYTEYFDNILKHGLKCAGHSANEFRIKDEEVDNDASIYNYPGMRNYQNDSGYRTITPRLFLINSNDNENILNVADQLDDKYVKHDKMIVLKIDLSKANIPLYKDNGNPNLNNCVYTFENIPKELISQDKELTELVRNAPSKVKEHFINFVKREYPKMIIENDNLMIYKNSKGIKLHHGAFGDIYKTAEYYGINIQRKLIGDTITEAFSGKEIKFILS